MDIRLQHGFASRSTLLVMVAALAAGLGLYTAQRYFSPAEAPAPVLPQQQLQSVRLITPPRVLPDYRLTLADGSALTPEKLRGHWTIVFLGFTHCPDVCPTTLAELKKAQDAWQPIAAASRPRILFVSADPERDTPQKTGEYAAFFHADTLAATAEPVALTQFTQALGLVFMKVPIDDGDYTIDHSSTLVVLDPQGRQAGLIRPPLDWKQIAGDLQRLTAASR